MQVIESMFDFSTVKTNMSSLHTKRSCVHIIKLTLTFQQQNYVGLPIFIAMEISVANFYNFIRKIQFQNQHSHQQCFVESKYNANSDVFPISPDRLG